MVNPRTSSNQPTISSVSTKTYSAQLLDLNLPPEKIYEFLTGDFRSLWNSLALNPSPTNNGNFTFALLDMILLEFVARLCDSDNSGSALRDFSRSLASIDKNYFERIRHLKGIRHDPALPFLHCRGGELIHVLFDLIRNGDAHYYQQIVANLSDGYLAIQTSGRTDVIVQSETGKYEKRAKGLLIEEIRNLGRKGHLEVKNGEGFVLISFRPEVFFLDITEAVDNSDLLKRGLSINYFSGGGTNYNGISVNSILTSLLHKKIKTILKGKKI
jgi:hypothetical protein